MTTSLDFQPLPASQKHPEAIRVLVVEDNQDYEFLLRSALVPGDDTFDLEFVRTLADALQAIRRDPPEVTLVDLGLEDSSGYSTFLRIREAEPGNCVIVLTGLDDEATAIRAIREGAQDYLVKSLTHPRGIAQRIRMALRNPGGRAPVHIPGKGLVLGFLGSKGGVGTSTLAENLAAILAREGYATAIVDLQPSPNRYGERGALAPAHHLTDLLGKPAEAITAADLKECSLELAPDLRLLAMKPAEGIWRPPAPEYVSAILSLVREFSPYVVVDLGSRVDGSVAIALKACDSVTVVLDTEVAAVDCCATLLRQLEVVLGPKGPEICLVTVDRLHHNQRLVAKRIAAHLKILPSLTVTAAPEDLSNAYMEGAPLLSLHHADEAFARSMQALSDLLVSSHSGREPAR